MRLGALLAIGAAAQAPTATPTYQTPAPFLAPPDDYDRTFDHDPGSCANYSPDEVYTGDALGLGGGLLASAVASLCHPESGACPVAALVDETHEARFGVYGVSLMVDARWTMVWVDAYFPCTPPGLSRLRGRTHTSHLRHHRQLDNLPRRWRLTRQLRHRLPHTVKQSGVLCEFL